MRKFIALIGVQTIAATSLIAVFAWISLPVLAQENEDSGASETSALVETDDADEGGAQPSQALTTDDPKIPLNQLEILLKPLSQEKLVVEADAWQVLLEEKSRNISQKEVNIKRQEAEGNIDNDLLVTVTNLQGEQANLIKRVESVVEALEVKGGDVSSYRQYLDAVSGLEFSFKNTEGLGVRLTTWLFAADGGIQVLINIAKFGGVLIVTVILAPRLTKLAAKALSRVNNVSELFRDFMLQNIKRGIYVVGGLIALAALGFDLGPILAVVGGASFVLAFALQSNLGNFASGLLLLINKPFDVGDEVKVAGYWSYVDSISLANTKLKDFNGNIITVPNNTVWGGEIINYTHSEIRRLELAINVKFNQNIDQIRELWMEITSAHPKVLDDPQPIIFPWNSSFDYYIYVGLKAYSKTEDYWGVYVDMLTQLQSGLEARGIQLAAPIQQIRLENHSEKMEMASSPLLSSGS